MLAVEKVKNQNDFAFFMEMGTGKTLSTITTLRYKFAEHKKILKTLILCPPIVIDNWQREFSIFSKIESRDIIPLKGPGKKRVETLKKYFGDKIFITNYESLLMEDLFNLLLEWGPEVLILDESHKCKDFRSKRTKQLLRMSPKTKYRYILTGTPILNSPMDLFSQFKILDNGETFGGNFFAFRSKYFYDKNSGMPKQKYFPDWRPIPDAINTMYSLMAPKSMHVKKQDCLDLPPLVTQDVFIELSKDQQAAYEDMKKDFIAYMGSKASVATIALTKGLRLMQIVSGFISVGEDSESRENLKFSDNPRAEALKELLAEITPNSKVLVWAVFKENYQTIRDVCNSLGVNFVEVHGDISAAKKQENVKTFNEDPKCRVFLGHPGSGGIGINMVIASYSIFYSRNFSLEQDLQAEARNHRGGSEIHAKVTRINLIAKGTIDEIVADALKNKVQIGENILNKIAMEV